MSRYNGGLAVSLIETIEQYLEFKFPREYREFIITYNGGEPEKKCFLFKDNVSDGSILRCFLGFIPNKYENILVIMRQFKNRVPENMLPIADDPYGNLVLISIKMADRGKIYFWDHETEADESLGEIPDYSNLTLVADNFDDFFNSLKSIEEFNTD